MTIMEEGTIRMEELMVITAVTVDGRIPCPEDLFTKF